MSLSLLMAVVRSLTHPRKAAVLGGGSVAVAAVAELPEAAALLLTFLSFQTVTAMVSLAPTIRSKWAFHLGSTVFLAASVECT